jgi:malate synthase
MPKKKTVKDNLYRTGVETLAAHMTLGKKILSLDENIKHLRSILSVDTIIEDINQEEALEFLEAIEGNIATEREETKDEMEELKTGLDDKFKEKDEEIEELKYDYDVLMKKTDFDLQIGTIEYRSPGIMDDMIMEALSEAYQLLTPLEIIDRLKVRKLKAV